MKSLDELTTIKLNECALEIAEIIEHYFPNAKDNCNFEERLKMTIYMEILHAGYENGYD